MIQMILPLVNWSNGVFMIGVFALVVIILVAVIYSMINSGSSTTKKDGNPDLTNNSKTTLS